MRIIVKPRAGMKVRDPDRPGEGHLPADGLVKEDSLAWRRLAAAGDVTIEPEPVAAVAPEAPAVADADAVVAKKVK